LKNTLDWISRVREGSEPPLAAYRDRVFALAAASNGAYGGMRSLMALRQVLELGCGALVIPEQVAVREAHRGKGLGGALAGTALEFCRTQHIKAVTTYWALDAGAARLAQHLGSKTERTYLYLEKRI